MGASDAVWRVVMHHAPEPNDEVYVYARDAHHAIAHGQEVYDNLYPGNKRGAIYAELARHETEKGSDDGMSKRKNLTTQPRCPTRRTRTRWRSCGRIWRMAAI